MGFLGTVVASMADGRMQRDHQRLALLTAMWGSARAASHGEAVSNCTNCSGCFVASVSAAAAAANAADCHGFASFAATHLLLK